MAKPKKNVHIGGFQDSLFAPNSDWKLRDEIDWPDFSNAKYIGLDYEAKDPNLMKMGPGFIRGDARPIGASLADENGRKIYLPFGHEQGRQYEQSKVVEYLRKTLKDDRQIKVGANLMYELEASAYLGVEIKGPLADIQIAEPLLDEEKESGYSLEALANDYLGISKSEVKLQEAASIYQLDPKSDMWRLDPKYVGEYAEDDAYLPIQILKQQMVRIEKEKLQEIWQLESDLLPVLFKMRARGIKVDLDRAEILSANMQDEENVVLRRIWGETGFKVDPWSSKSLAIFCNQLGLGFHVEFTAPSANYPQGQPSFKNEWFERMAGTHEVFRALRDFRVMSKMRRDFVEGLILNNNIRGRLHPQWHQLRQNDEDRENGTRTGRIASSKPNLTQIPVRDPVWGKKIRSIFVADEGGKYCKNDFSSQEPRILLHFAYIKRYKGSVEARQRYLDNLYTDYHQMVADLIFERTGKKVERRPAKDINLGAAYGMGFYKLMMKLGLEEAEARALLKTYHEGVPYVQLLSNRCMEIVQGQGFIRTVLGRKRRFNKWEPVDWEKKKRSTPVTSYELAVEMWGQAVERHNAHKALNAVCQGSAADQTKRAIILLDSIGLTPQIQVYDELGQTIWNDDDAWRIKEVMEHAIEFEIPHLADPAVGDSWGETKEWRGDQRERN